MLKESSSLCSASFFSMKSDFSFTNSSSISIVSSMLDNDFSESFTEIDPPSTPLWTDERIFMIFSLFSIVKTSNGLAINFSIKTFWGLSSDDPYSYRLRGLDIFVKEKSGFIEKKDALQRELDSFNIDELKQKENLLTRTSTDKTDAESRIKKLEQAIEEIKKSLPQILMDVEIRLRRISAIKYHVKE